MQDTGMTPKPPLGNDGETTLKVSKQIHHEMITEFPKFGFTTLGQYTDFVLKRRMLLMESLDPSNHIQVPALAPQPVPAQAAPQGVFISEEEMAKVRDAIAKGEKAQVSFENSERKAKALSNVLEGLLTEAINFREGFLVSTDRDDYFTQLLNDLLRKEGLTSW